MRKTERPPCCATCEVRARLPLRLLYIMTMGCTEVDSTARFKQAMHSGQRDIVHWIFRADGSRQISHVTSAARCICTCAHYRFPCGRPGLGPAWFCGWSV